MVISDNERSPPSCIFLSNIFLSLVLFFRPLIILSMELGRVPPTTAKSGRSTPWRQPLKRIDYELILDDFDRLLPLYQFVETDGKTKPVSVELETRFCFQPGLRPKKRKAIVEQSHEQIERDLRHNELQKALYRRLAREFGKQNVGTENRGVNGTSIDLVVRRKPGYWFYEIKTANTVRACLREALGQLLEYSFWPGAQKQFVL